MKAILVLVDFQQDYLASARLEPAAGLVVQRAAQLLVGARQLSVPVVHVWTTVDRQSDQRMPHWQRAGKWQCVRGTPGHEPPQELRPVPGESIVHKRFFSAFGTGELERLLEPLQCDLVLLAGLHLHACVRATALGAYELGYAVGIADDAVASDDPLHAAISRRYLQDRVAEFKPVSAWLKQFNAMEGLAVDQPAKERPLLPDAIVAGEEVRRPGLSRIDRCCPAQNSVALESVPIASGRETAAAAGAARQAWPDWARSDAATRARLLMNWADRIAADAGLAMEIARETGKPIRNSREEVAGTVKQLRALASRVPSELDLLQGEAIKVRQRAMGVIAVITPWNNPIYIPAGKIGAALLYGNSVVWKPAPAASWAALRLLGLLCAAGAPKGVVNLVLGDGSTGRFLMEESAVDAVTLTGSAAAGYSAQDVCGRRHIPLQAELGGNNAAIVWSDSDLALAASWIAEGAFAMAGQRCTANRRVIVEERCWEAFLAQLVPEVARLRVGDPLDPTTQVGPVISLEQRDTLLSVLDRASARGVSLLAPSEIGDDRKKLTKTGAYLWPTIALADDPGDELVQEETFGPILVVQRAADWDEAMARCNGVRQGLAAALFSDSPDLRHRFFTEAQAGILKINRSTAGAEVDFPFGGWKASGFGPPEHGASDQEFHTRTQTLYL